MDEWTDSVCVCKRESLKSDREGEMARREGEGGRGGSEIGDDGPGGGRGAGGCKAEGQRAPKRARLRAAGAEAVIMSNNAQARRQ